MSLIRRPFPARRVPAVAVLAAALTSAPIAVAAASTATDQVGADDPVATVVDDAITVQQGSTSSLDPIANDSTPDGGNIYYCGLSDKPSKKVAYLTWLEGELHVTPSAKLRKSSFTVGYFACDAYGKHEGTITVTVSLMKHVTVKAVKAKRRFRACNPNPFKAYVGYGKDMKPRRGITQTEGNFWIKPNSCRKPRVRTVGRVEWESLFDTDSLGNVYDIRRGVVRVKR